jgi:hypothetical protein
VLGRESQIGGELIRFLWMRILLLIGLLIPAIASAQSVEVRITISESTASMVQISGNIRDQKTRNLSFVRSVGGFDKLGERVSAMVLKDRGGKIVPYQTPIPGEFVADADITEFSYILDLSPHKQQLAAAHVSWIANSVGVLMPDDMMPRFSFDKPMFDLSLNLPTDWKSTFTAGKLLDVQNAVFYIGKSLAPRTVTVGKASFNIVKPGDWQFSDKDLEEAISEIARDYERVFANSPHVFTVALLKFPNSTQPGQWQAETRGRNITIVSSDMAFKTQSIQRLHEQLRHEMFHLWIPNGVNLSGKYDWFYEGFALYQSLKTALALNRIRFDDFLDTLSRAQAIDARQTNRLSLIDASNKRWANADTYIYARGMVTAFLFDIQMLNASKGKRSVENLIHELYSKHRFPAEQTEGNSAILAIAGQYPELGTVVERYVNGDGKFDWQAELSLAGLEAKPALSVIAKPNGRQKDLLDRLGYNNWKRSSPTK